MNDALSAPDRIIGPATWDMAIESSLWVRNWHLIAHRSELAATSQYLRFNIFGEEIVVFNDGAEVVAFDNLCPHRGTRIFVDNQGKQRWVCPYHGWSFSKGRLFVAKKESFTNCDPSSAKLAEYKTQWAGDFLFVSKDPAHTLSSQLGSFYDIVVSISRSISQQRDLNAYSYPSNWKIAVENALDQYHVALVHSDTLHRLRMGLMVDRFDGANNIAHAPLGDKGIEKKLKSISRFFDLRFNPPGYFSLYLFPFTFITSTMGFSYSLQQFYPALDAETCHFSSRFFSSKLAESTKPSILESFFSSAVSLNRRVFEEDAEICARIPLRSWTLAAPEFSSAEENKVREFRHVLGKWSALMKPTGLSEGERDG